MSRFPVLRYVLVVFTAILTLAAHQGGHQEKQQQTPEPGRNILWTDPGDPSLRDFVNGTGGTERQPQPPFSFVDEDMLGTSPKVNITDGRGQDWNVKWRHEVSPSVFCTRL